MYVSSMLCRNSLGGVPVLDAPKSMYFQLNYFSVPADIHRHLSNLLQDANKTTTYERTHIYQPRKPTRGQTKYRYKDRYIPGQGRLAASILWNIPRGPLRSSFLAPNQSPCSTC